jgi:hypothetical protein
VNEGCWKSWTSNIIPIICLYVSKCLTSRGLFIVSLSCHIGCAGTSGSGDLLPNELSTHTGLQGHRGSRTLERRIALLLGTSRVGVGRIVVQLAPEESGQSTPVTACHTGITVRGTHSLPCEDQISPWAQRAQMFAEEQHREPPPRGWEYARGTPEEEVEAGSTVQNVCQDSRHSLTD